MNFSILVLSGSYRETGIQTRGLATAAGREGFRFDQFYLKTEKLLRKKEPQKILIECRQDFSVSLFAGLEEIRERIDALRRSGKEVFFHASTYGMQELYLAAACSYRLIHPMGSLRFTGLTRSFIFVKRLLRKYGIEAEIFRRGEYKSAGETLGSDEISGPNRTQYEQFFSFVMEAIRTAVADGFGKSGDDLKELESGRILTAEEAADASWIDEIVSFNDFKHRWEEQKDKEVSFKHELKKAGGRLLLPSGQLAVLVFEGSIVDGVSRRDPMLGQAVGAESFIPHIRSLRKNRKVKAVVLRINSGGGSAFASEDITAELRLLAEEKPLVVSMSEVAGSGGYWMSCCGRKTFALQSTLTGSIGVISMYLSIRGLLENLGIAHDTIKTGDFADTGSSVRRMTEAEKKIIDSEIGNMYGNFVSMVADFRKMSEQQIDTLGRGRVWSGADACSNGLADAVGGLSAAIAEAAEAAGLKHPILRFYPEVHRGIVERMIMNMGRGGDEAAGVFLKGMGKIITDASVNTGPLALMEEAVFKWN